RTGRTEMERETVNGAGKKRIAAGTSRIARETNRRLAIYSRNARKNHRSAIARVVRRVRERFGRTFSADGGGAKEPSRAPRRIGRAYSANDARGDGGCAALSAIECRSFDRGHSLSRFRQTLGEPLSRERFRDGLRRTRRTGRPHFDW